MLRHNEKCGTCVRGVAHAGVLGVFVTVNGMRPGSDSEPQRPLVLTENVDVNPTIAKSRAALCTVRTRQNRSASHCVRTCLPDGRDAAAVCGTAEMPVKFCPLCRRHFSIKHRKHLYSDCHVRAATAWVQKATRKVATFRRSLRHPAVRKEEVCSGAGAGAGAGRPAQSDDNAAGEPSPPASFWCHACDCDIHHEKEVAW